MQSGIFESKFKFKKNGYIPDWLDGGLSAG